MAYGLRVGRSGRQYRVAGPDWEDPLDPGFAKDTGGRWNAQGAFGALYLNDSILLARLQVAHRIAGYPYGVEDLDPSEQDDLVAVDVARLDVLDCVTGDGLAAVGLPGSYPRDVPWSACHPIGQSAYEDGAPGIACRSAATGATVAEELVVFDTAVEAVTAIERLAFDDWYWD
jgi:hypothetical protein